MVGKAEAAGVKHMTFFTCRWAPHYRYLKELVDEAIPYHSISQFRGDYLFIDSILEDRSISPSFYDGPKAQEVIVAAKQAHQSGCWVSLWP